MKYLKHSWPLWVVAGVLGLCKAAGFVESVTRKASQLDTMNHMSDMVHDIESETTDWCVLALLDERTTAQGELTWKAGETARLGDYEVLNFGYGLTNPTGPVTMTHRGETYMVKPLYESVLGGSGGISRAEKDVLEVERTCHNVEIIVH